MPGHRFLSVLALSVLFAGTGCLQELKLPGLPSAGELEEETRTADHYRERYQADKDPEAIKWLLKHRVRQGMSPGDVNSIIGEDGQLRLNDFAYKRNNVAYRLSDEAYQWGPDSDGKAYVLIFRDDRLVNFNPHRFE